LNTGYIRRLVEQLFCPTTPPDLGAESSPRRDQSEVTGQTRRSAWLVQGDVVLLEAAAGRQRQKLRTKRIPLPAVGAFPPIVQQL